MTLASAEEREQALRSKALSRLEILNALANYRAWPWYAPYPLPAVVEGWHCRYDDL